MIELVKYIPAKGYRSNCKNSLSLRKNGCIIISKKLSDNMKMGPDSFIELAQNKVSPEQWFIAKSQDGMKARELKGNYILQSKPTCSAILDSIGKDFETQKGFTMLVSSEPALKQDGQEWFEIITASAK